MKTLKIAGLMAIVVAVLACVQVLATNFSSPTTFGPVTVTNDVATGISSGSYLVFGSTCQLYKVYLASDAGTNITLSMGPTGGNLLVARSLHAQGLRVGSTNYVAGVWNSLSGSAGATNTLVFSLSTYSDEKGVFYIVATNAALNTLLSVAVN